MNENRQLQKFAQYSVSLSQASSLEQATEILITLGTALLNAQSAALWLSAERSPLQLITSIGKEGKSLTQLDKILTDSQTKLDKEFTQQLASYPEERELLKNFPQLNTYLENNCTSCLILRITDAKTQGYLLFFFNRTKKIPLLTRSLALLLVEQFIPLLNKLATFHPSYDLVLKRMEGLLRITALLSNAKTKEEVSRIIIKECFEMIDAEVGEVSLYQKESQTYDVIVQIGYPEKLTKNWPKIYSAKDAYLTNKVIQTKQPLFISDATILGNEYKTLNEIIEVLKLKSLALIPLIIKGHVFGSINFFFKSPQKFTDFDKKTLLWIAEKCSQVLDRVITQEKYEESRLELDKILMKIREGVIIRNTNREILFMNQEAQDIYQYIHANIDASTSKQLISIKDDNDNEIDPNVFQFEKVLEKPMIYEKDECLIFSDGTSRWIRIKSFPIIINKSLQHVVDILLDITDLKNKEQVKEEFMSIASHELKTPLTSLTLYMQSLEKKLTQADDASLQTVLQKASEQVQRVNMLVKDMLDVTRMKYGNMQVKKRHFLLDDVVKETISDIQKTITTHSIHLLGHSKGNVFADSEKIRQVLTNLITNAVKYSPGATKIDIIISEKNGFARVCVRDQGIGIDKEDLKHIFRPFERTASKEKLHMPGIGLGLYIAMEIMKVHKGKLWANSSKEKKQTTFCFQLPVV